jgi:hypothetical protein
LKVRVNKIIFTSLLSLVLCHPFEQVNAEPAETPRHLALARELVANVKPENNRYGLGEQSISLPGDILSSGYSFRADCSGFLLAIFDRSKYSIQQKMSYQSSSSKRRRPTAEDFVLSIEQGTGYKHIRRVADIVPGDILAHAMLRLEDQKQTNTTGHVFLIDSYPKAITPRNPIVEGTDQFEISIIDSNEEYVGADDSRLSDPSNKIKGLGKGTIRIYSDSNGELVGWARTFTNTNRFFSYSVRFPSDTKLRKAAIGRPIVEH